MIEFLGKLVAIDSPTNDVEGNAAVAALVETELKTLGAAVERIEYPGVGVHLVGRLPCGHPGAKKLILSAHMDTVFPRGEVAAHPFRIEGDNAYGLGISDCKGGVAVAIGVVKKLQTEGRMPDDDIVFVFTCDEEKGSPTGSEVIRREARGAAACYGFEPARGGNGVITYRPGYVTARIRVRGVKSHAFNGYDKGVSAPFVLAKALVALEKLNDAEKGILYTPYDVSSGKDLGSVVDRAETGILVPLFDKDYLAVIEKNLADDIVKVIEAEGATAEVEINRSAGMIMQRTEATVRLYERLREAGARLGIEVPEEKAFAPSDMNEYSDLGVPTVDGLGPYSFGLHVLDEHIRLSSVEEKISLVAEAIAGVRK